MVGRTESVGVVRQEQDQACQQVIHTPSLTHTHYIYLPAYLPFKLGGLLLWQCKFARYAVVSIANTLLCSITHSVK